MPKDKLDENNEEWKKKLDKDGKPYLLYTPSPDYWKEKLKIVFYALETGCDPEEAEYYESGIAEGFGGDAGVDNDTLCRYKIFVYCLYERLNGTSREELEKLFSKISKTPLLIEDLKFFVEKDLQKKKNIDSIEKQNIEKLYLRKFYTTLFEDIGADKLRQIAQKIFFLNLQKRVNTTGNMKFNDKRKEELHEFLSSKKYREFTLSEIAYSDADIVILAGEDCLNGICSLFNATDTKKYRKELGYPENESFDLDWKTKKIIPYGKTLFVSVYHPSPINTRFTPEYILDQIDSIIFILEVVKRLPGFVVDFIDNGKPWAWKYISNIRLYFNSDDPHLGFEIDENIEPLKKDKLKKILEKHIKDEGETGEEGEWIWRHIDPQYYSDFDWIVATIENMEKDALKLLNGVKRNIGNTK